MDELKVFWTGLYRRLFDLANEQTRAKTQQQVEEQTHPHEAFRQLCRKHDVDLESQPFSTALCQIKDRAAEHPLTSRVAREWEHLLQEVYARNSDFRRKYRVSEGDDVVDRIFELLHLDQLFEHELWTKHKLRAERIFTVLSPPRSSFSHSAVSQPVPLYREDQLDRAIRYVGSQAMVGAMRVQSHQLQKKRRKECIEAIDLETRVTQLMGTLDADDGMRVPGVEIDKAYSLAVESDTKEWRNTCEAINDAAEVRKRLQDALEPLQKGIEEGMRDLDQQIRKEKQARAFVEYNVYAFQSNWCDTLCGLLERWSHLYPHTSLKLELELNRRQLTEIAPRREEALAQMDEWTTHLRDAAVQLDVASFRYFLFSAGLQLVQRNPLPVRWKELLRDLPSKPKHTQPLSTTARSLLEMSSRTRAQLVKLRIEPLKATVKTQLDTLQKEIEAYRNRVWDPAMPRAIMSTSETDDLTPPPFLRSILIKDMPPELTNAVRERIQQLVDRAEAQLAATDHAGDQWLLRIPLLPLISQLKIWDAVNLKPETPFGIYCWDVVPTTMELAAALSA